jgi:hypothetical protein
MVPIRWCRSEGRSIRVYIGESPKEKKLEAHLRHGIAHLYSEISTSNVMSIVYVL